MPYEEVRKPAAGVTAARDFHATGIHCGIKPSADALDLGLVFSTHRAAAAGVFTQNRVVAAPVVLSRHHLRDGMASAVLVNSGNANACTGQRGKDDAASMARRAAVRLGLPEQDVLVMSTGVIGVPLPMERIAAGIERLRPEPQGGESFARAIMTTDTREKVAAASWTAGGATFTVGGAAKGAGMIHPNMATLLGIVTTDAAADPAFLQAVLQRAADRSFNLISIDGDTSTNDSIVLLANGAAGGPVLHDGHPHAPAFEAAVLGVCTSLAKQVVRDGEGARTLIEVRVVGARNDEDARLAARAIASSSLVKTAVFGGDPNWGRVLCAAGYSGAALDADHATLLLEDMCLLRQGEVQPYDRTSASSLLLASDVHFTLDLGLGDGSAVAWGCDLSYDYVRINAEYTT